jgi:RecA/RadA recombinase
MPSPPVGPSGRPARERILVYGETSSGKTSAALSLAAFHQRRGSEARFFALSSGDLAYEQMLDAPRYAALTNVEYEDCFEYGDWITHGRRFLEAAKKRAKTGPSEDWLIVDLYSSLWGLVQQTYIDQIATVAGKDDDSTDFWTRAALRAETSNNGFEMFSDINWQFCNKIYGDIQRIMGRWPGHVIAVAAAKPVEKDRGGKVTEADANYAEWFGKLGSKPAGQKEMAYEFRDVVFCKRLGNGKHTLTTAKARERAAEPLKGAEWDVDSPLGFFGAFLKPVAGWKI